MIQFIKDALTELEHIVWPTPTESKNYMLYTVGTIIVVGAFLAVAGYALRSGLVYTRSQFPHSTLSTQTVSGEDAITSQDVEKILDKVSVESKSDKAVLSTGSLSPDTISGSINSAPVASGSAK